MNSKYLIVENTVELRNEIAEELRKSPTTAGVLSTGSGEEALEILEQNPDIDMVVLDLNLESQMYGMEVLRRIKEYSTVLVVILTTDEAPERQTEAMSWGADGFMHKRWFRTPEGHKQGQFKIRNFLETIIERKRLGTAPVLRHYEFEGWILDARQSPGQVFNPEGGEVTLNDTEFDLLLTFVENPQKVLSQDELIKKTGGARVKDPNATLIKQLSRLRRKIDKGRQTSFIRTAHAAGFFFAPTVNPMAKGAKG